MEIADAAARRLVEDLDGPEATMRLRDLGFSDPEQAALHLKRIRDGSSRRQPSAEARRRMLDLAPALLSAARRSAAPDRALARLADFLDRVGARQTFVALLAENPATLGLLLNLFASSEYLTGQLLAHPELLDTLVRSDLATVSKSQPEFESELTKLLASADDLEQRLDVMRRYRHDEFLRIGLHDVQGEVHYSEVSEQLSALAEALLAQARRIALDERSAAFGVPAGLDLAVVAMGKLGGRELNYHSDLDLIFVYGPSGADPGRSDGCRISPHEFFAKVAQQLLSNLQIATREGYVYKIDTRLRPSGNAGTLVTSLDGFARYHASSSAVWERQALIRARPVAGSAPLRAAVAKVIEEFVYGRSLTDEERREIARLRGRMERELAREDAHHFNLKTGRGGLVDVEFVAQVLVLTHGHAHPAVRQRATRGALDALGAERLLTPPDHRLLTRALSFFRGLENRLRIEGDSPVERVGRDPAALARAARRMGFEEPGARAGERLLEEWTRHRESVRAAFERLVAPIPEGD
jgi:glutamate-ammonia-ligase adenylyltransferase